ncbi:hypothetical protein ANASTE_00874 [Anaerofustis stercorihominis DSM 17244]|uniref:Bacterial membrane protein YfhO n=4 Tax=Anaerofustis stercorihominis TaxID=214853 RepID=B1C817_9FIRM|nr:YfhO family protein [Anaerofustis stercorihominis]EDS73154.1 hypothetical protein ANASTE_00874 [Anaerofustis stercorihominis DSM 17244]
MVMIGISAISNFYFLYMLTIAVVFYAIVRVLYLYKDKGLFIKMFFKYLFVLGGYYLLSILLVSVLFIPVIYGFLYCSRISKDTGVNLLLYHCNYYLSFISQLFQVKEVGNYQSFNITIVTFLSCIMLVNLQDKISKYLKYILFILIISSFLPIIGLVMNGGSYISNRWSFVFSFVVSFITVFIFNNFKIYLLKYKKSIMKTSCIYGFLILVSSIILIFITKKNDAENLLPYYYYYISFVFLNISILLIYIASQKCKNKIIYNNIILIIVFLNLCIPAYLYLSTSGGNYVDSFLSREYAYSTLKDKNIKYVKKNDQSIYRIGISNVGTSSKYTYNYGMANNIPGTSSYYSLINKNLTELYNETGNIGLKNLSNLTGFNNREVFNSLFGIKYYILAEKENKSTIPYGYTKLKENELIYKNNNDLPLFYTYNSFISRKDYEQLELNKKESSMLQGVVLDNEIKYRKTKLKFNDETVLNNEDIYNILNKNNSIMISKNKIIAKEDNTELKIPFKGDENNEYYLIFKSLSYKNNNNSLFPSYYTGSNVKINFSKSKRDDNIVSLKTSNHPNYFGKLNLLYNLGRYDKKSDCILIKLSKKGEYSFSDMKLVRQSMNDFSNHIDKLKEDKLNKLTIDGNYVEANITTKEDKIGVLAIPYSPGWKAYVNGQETEVLRANTAFMGVKLEKGNNSIVFKYTTPGLREGAIISLITILLTLLYVKFKKYKIKIS